MKKLLMTAAVLLTSSMGSSLTNSSTITSNKGLQTSNAIYDFHETYYTSDHDSSEIHTLMSWKQFGYDNWNQLISNLKWFGIQGSVSVTLSSGGDNYYADLMAASDKVTNDPNNTLKLVAQRFVTASYYTALIIYIWHDDNNVLFRWNGYFKGDTTNGVNITFNQGYFSNLAGGDNPNITQVGYNWSETYYKSSEDHSGNYRIIDLSNYGSWGQFEQNYPVFEINGSLKSGISGSNSDNEISFKHTTYSISDNNQTSIAWIAPYFETAGRYTIIIMYIWHDDKNVIFQWDAYFKGNVTNTVDINVNSFTFYGI